MLAQSENVPFLQSENVPFGGLSQRGAGGRRDIGDERFRAGAFGCGAPDCCSTGIATAWSGTAFGVTFTYNGQRYTGPGLTVAGTTQTLGSAIGNVLGKGTVGKLAASTLLGALGGQIGNILSLSGVFEGKLTAGGLDAALNLSFQQFGKDFGGQTQSSINGGISSFLMGEAASALGLTGFSGRHRRRRNRVRQRKVLVFNKNRLTARAQEI